MARITAATHLRHACAGLALCGCAVGPDYHPPEPAAPPHWTVTDHADAPNDLSEWWRRIDDPLLSDLIEEVLLGSPDLRGARARLREARARRAAAAGVLLPSVTASATAHRNGDVGDGERDLFSAGFDASWELDLFGGVRRSVEAAEA